MFPFPLVWNRHSDVIFQIMKPFWTERTFMHKLQLFLMSSGLKWLFGVMAAPARLTNNLGCHWALPDGWNEMPPLAFHQLGEIVIPTGWWLLFWHYWCSWGAHKIPLGDVFLLLSSSVRGLNQLPDFPLSSSFCLLVSCLHTGSGKTYPKGRWPKSLLLARDPPQSPLEAGWSPRLLRAS